MALINNLPLLPAERVMYRHGTALRAAPSNNNKATRIVNKNSTCDTVFFVDKYLWGQFSLHFS